MAPAYRFPPGLGFRAAGSALLGLRRDLRADAQQCMEGLTPSGCFLGEENLPEGGPFLLLMNHYCRPGFPVWWLSLAITSRLKMEHTWVIASQWTAPGKWYEPLKEAASRALFARLAGTYGFLPMPPMPPRTQDTAARAAAVRAVLTYVERNPQAGLCLAPEGRDVPGGALGWPPLGAGRFILLLTARGMPVLPVGGWEQDGTLTVRFGEPYRLKMPVLGGGQVTRERDRLIAGTVMRSIARLLPEPMRGEFA